MVVFIYCCVRETVSRSVNTTGLGISRQLEATKRGRKAIRDEKRHDRKSHTRHEVYCEVLSHVKYYYSRNTTDVKA